MDRMIWGKIKFFWQIKLSFAVIVCRATQFCKNPYNYKVIINKPKKILLNKMLDLSNLKNKS